MGSNTSSLRSKLEASAKAGRPQNAPAAEFTNGQCLRNDDASKIDEHGFVELSQALPPALIEVLHGEAVEKVRCFEEAPKLRKRKRGKQTKGIEQISNALQVDVSEGLLQRMVGSIEGCDKIRETMEVVFGKEGGGSGVASSGMEPGGGDGAAFSTSTQQTEGRERPSSTSNYDGFVVETPKLLITKPGSRPQLSHADDLKTSCVICLIHLRDGQESTRVAKYEGSRKDYPTGITVTCHLCNREEQLPDADFRRGVHLTGEPWECECDKPHMPFDLQGKVMTAFGELLGEGSPNLCKSYAGEKVTKAGDGLLCLPTLIHQGPGNPAFARESRYLLFFTLRPVYKNTKSGGKEGSNFKYDPKLQFHAAAIIDILRNGVCSNYEDKGHGEMREMFDDVIPPKLIKLERENRRLEKENDTLKKKQKENSPDEKTQPEPTAMAAGLELHLDVNKKDGKGQNVAEHITFTMQQFQPCALKEGSNNARTTLPPSYPGLQCKHCTQREFFYTSGAHLSNNFGHFIRHLMQCNECPTDIKSALSEKQSEYKSGEKTPRGSQKKYFEQVVWPSLHSGRGTTSQ